MERLIVLNRRTTSIEWLLLLILYNVVQLFLHSRCTAENRRGILLNKLLRQVTGLLLDIVPLWIVLLLHVPVLPHAGVVVADTLSLHLSVALVDITRIQI